MLLLSMLITLPLLLQIIFNPEPFAKQTYVSFFIVSFISFIITMCIVYVVSISKFFNVHLEVLCFILILLNICDILYVIQPIYLYTSLCFYLLRYLKYRNFLYLGLITTCYLYVKLFNIISYFVN